MFNAQFDKSSALNKFVNYIARGMANFTSSTPGKKVIVAVDGSDNSIFALEWYVKNIHKQKDFVILLYCVEVSEILAKAGVKMTDGHAFKKVIDDEAQVVDTKLKEIGAHLTRLQLKGAVKSKQATKAGEGVIEVAQEEGASLIVTGSRGLGKLRRTLLGSVSDYLVHHSHIPVLVCRSEDK